MFSDLNNQEIFNPSQYTVYQDMSPRLDFIFHSILLDIDLP